MILTGMMGVSIALLAASVAAPKRRGLSAAAMRGDKPRGATLREVCGYLIRNWRLYGPMFLGISLASLHMFGFVGWRTAFFGRTYGWGPATTGLYSRLINLGIALPALGGAVLITDLFYKRGYADRSSHRTKCADRSRRVFPTRLVLASGIY